ncbi:MULTISPECIES: lysine biosynthesis protein LysW [Deinococcus]|uniref:Alpha-aminoadipate carrier protein LysW n=1 Tax=Deinococcus cellulosilyticus (strain DSM 18568 / NBRC 106333 / KACC 11606 / 5516J-15) TaxID=1223518 RepID=A0A511N6T4_DEIC1|nr:MULTISPECIES: lysine biosynthesis protein LysW [Deinococcus]GEM48555.1 alpha-aminoadipate carrier protein LysW [Deinococcus cellulosilyticus NBRC 106333 = KACC 11606]
MATVSFECPECGGTIELNNPELGELVICDECGAELEVTSLEPPVLSLAPQEAEDWGE